MLFDGRMRQTQVNGMNVFLDYWENGFASNDDRWLAYMLATAYHEVDKKMQPIKEYGSDAYFFRMYDIEGQRLDVARDLGNTQPGDGVKFHGRGYVQLTRRRNYQDMSNRLGVDLVSNPELALESDIAARIIFEGMIDGSFTRKKLSGYFNPTTERWKQAMRIVNRLDKVALIAGYGKLFYCAKSYTVAS